MKPKQKIPVFIILTNGEIYEDHWLKDINKYERNVNRWRIYKTGKTVADEEVLAWIDKDDLQKMLSCMAADRNGDNPYVHYNIDI